MTQKNLQKGIGMPVTIAIIILVIVVASVAYYTIQQKSEEAMMEKETEAMMEKKDNSVMMDKETEAMMEKKEPTTDAMMKKVDDTMMKEMMTMVYQYSTQLIDVTDGNTISGISTSGNGLGVAKSSFKDGVYSLLATFENLPDPEGSDFYEGWVVRKNLGFSVLSTGKVERVDGVYTNVYLSGEDLTDHDFYVLTIEPDDGNPAPADHILEGTMTK